MSLQNRNDIGNLLQKEGFETAIEVGVQSGAYSDILISKWNSCRLYVMIDPWLKQKHYDDSANFDNNVQQQIFHNAMKVVNKYNNVEFIILKTTSKLAVKYVKNLLYDFIYLDGRHDYVSVKQDINMYFPLLKPGGILAGHDYLDTANEANPWKLDENGNVNNEKKAVKSAVDEFANKSKLHVITTNEEKWKSWLIRKPIIK